MAATEENTGAPQAAPEWWVSQPDAAATLCEQLAGVETSVLGQTAGGRDIMVAAIGAREPLPDRTSNSLGSALAGGRAAAFYGDGDRERQSLLVVGNAHGIEFEGTVVALNLLNIVVTGSDLRGRPWPALQEAASQLRLVVIPHLNMDGRCRYSEVSHFLDHDMEAYRQVSQGDWLDGSPLKWPTSKLQNPIPPDQVQTMGGYFNDNGVNLVYDTGLGVDPQPEVRALLAFCRDEMPDCAVCSHTDRGSLLQPPDSYIPDHFRQRQTQVAAFVTARAQRDGIINRHLVSQRSYGYAGQVMYQTDLIYHACGALPLLFEFPCGYKPFPYSFDEILDIGLAAMEEIIFFGLQNRFRPVEAKKSW
jgi:hypothetical protein